jgi:hypothetical protein
MDNILKVVIVEFQVSPPPPPGVRGICRGVGVLFSFIQMLKVALTFRLEMGRLEEGF